MPESTRACLPPAAPAARTAALRPRRRSLLALLVPVLAAAQGIDVARGDLYLRGGRLASGGWGCGFAILANHRTREDPHVEWDINVEQVNNGVLIRTTVTASSFTVTRKARTPRSLAGGLSFLIDQDPDPIRLQGPAADSAGATDGTLRGELSSDDANRLFAAVGAGSFVTILVGAQQPPAESLRFHFVRDSAGPAQGAFAELCRPTPPAREPAAG
jgi:hypothetical protein